MDLSQRSDSLLEAVNRLFQFIHIQFTISDRLVNLLQSRDKFIDVLEFDGRFANRIDRKNETVEPNLIDVGVKQGVKLKHCDK